MSLPSEVTTAATAPAPIRATARHLRTASDEELVARVQNDGDRVAQDELIRRFLPLARSLAKRYMHTSEPADDLVQVACMGFLAAVKRFDPDYGRSLRTFAVPTMLGELRKHFRDTGWALRVPRSLQERGATAAKALDELTAQLGRSPTPSEVAERIGASVEEVIEALEARHAYRPQSVDAPADEDDDSPAAGARVGAVDPGFERVELTAGLEQALRALPERERMIVALRFAEDMTQSEIASVLGISQMHVSRLLRRALDRVSTLAGGEPDQASGDLAAAA